MTTLLLLAPGTPMLFQGQEFAASSPFLFFADHKEELAKLIGKGRAKFLARGQGYTLFLTPEEAVFSLERRVAAASKAASLPFSGVTSFSGAVRWQTLRRR